MSSYPFPGCGLPTKPRSLEPSMFQIFTWAAKDDLVKSTVVENVPQCCHQTRVIIPKVVISHPENQTQTPTQHHLNSEVFKIPQQEAYKEHKSPIKRDHIQKQAKTIPQIVVDNNQPKIFQASHLFKKQIRNQLNSYEAVNLRASRAKSTHVNWAQQTEKINHYMQQVQLDQKTIKQRKQKLKEFEVFTRMLPNSAFTTYYGKPAFENYGRGTSYKNHKSFNVMPHKGDNHPKNVQSHYTALLKARNVKSKSHLPRKPIEDIFPIHKLDQNQQSIEVPSLPLEKPDLIKSKRFATITQSVGKKGGPPQTTKRNIHSAKRANVHKSRQQKSVSFKQPTGDGLKYLNKRQNLIDLLEQKKLKASQLAYKVTECYPMESEYLKLQESVVSKENWDELKPAGKASSKGEALKNLIESQFVLKQNNSL